jgi:hypothetical protein
MSIAFDKPLAPAASAKSEASSDGMILLIAALALVVMVAAFALAPVASQGDISGSLMQFGI